MAELILALDQGTSSTRAILFDAQGEARHQAQFDFDQSFPADGWVEQDPEVIWQTSVSACTDVLRQVGRGDRVLAMGISNQRETTVLWDRGTGQALAPAIVWQDRRTASDCQRIRDDGAEAWLSERTGLLADPYFSSTKVRWLLDHVPGARARAERGELAVGTVDSFLIWRLSGARGAGGAHVSDASNASRTQLLNLQTGQWDPELLEFFDVPASVLPSVCDSAGAIATAQKDHFGLALPITGVAGDQQAALVGQACLREGMSKTTYGTGCFALTHTGDTIRRSANRLLSTIAYRYQGQCSYALEGSIFVAGAAIKWLRDRLGVISTAADSERIARALNGETRGVYVVPAFAGLGAPYWDADARGLICGLTLDSSADEIVLATLQSMAFQTHDLLNAARADGAELNVLRVDGGMMANRWLCQFLADVLDLPVECPAVTETTALGAALLAGVGYGLHSSLADLNRQWRLRERFEPHMSSDRRASLLGGWRDAVARVRAQPRA